MNSLMKIAKVNIKIISVVLCICLISSCSNRKESNSNNETQYSTESQGYKSVITQETSTTSKIESTTIPDSTNSPATTVAPVTTSPVNTCPPNTNITLLTPINLYSDENVDIVNTGKESNITGGFNYNLLILNKSDKELCVQTRNCYVNGVRIDPAMSSNVAPGHQVKGQIKFLGYQLDDFNITAITNVKFIFFVSSNSCSEFYESGTVSIDY